MKGERDYRDFLNDILRYAEMGERIISDVGFDAFCSNEEKILAAIQVLEVIGEGIEVSSRIAQETISRSSLEGYRRNEG